MITLRGVGVVSAAIVTFVLAGATRVGWLFLFDAVLWGTAVVSAIMPWLAMGRLQVQRRMLGWDGAAGAPGPMEGDVVEFEVTLMNSGALPCVFPTVDYSCEGNAVDRGRLFIAWLGRRERISSIVRVRFERRGLHRLPPVEVVSAVPFGLFRRSRRFGEVTQLVVLPRVFPIKRLNMLAGVAGATRRSRAARLGGEVAGSRDYSPGDPLRHVHWRNTARLARPQVKEFEDPVGESLVIAFAPSLSQIDGGECLEYGVKIAASVGDFICRSGGTVRILVGRFDVETSSRQHLLEVLALLEGGAGPTLGETLRQVSVSSSVFCIVLDSDVDGARALTRLASSGHRVAAALLCGFDLAHARDSGSQLRSAGVHVVECRNGDVQGAIAAIERASHLRDLSTSVDIAPR